MVRIPLSSVHLLSIILFQYPEQLLSNEPDSETTKLTQELALC